MKTKLLSAVGISLFSLMTVNSVFAQNPKRKVLPQVTITSNNTSVTQRVLTNFEKLSSGASNVRWTEINNRYLAKYEQNNMKHNALFLKRGYRVYDVGYGYEKDLPSDIRKMVTSYYKDHDVSRVFEIQQDNRRVWIVNLQNPKSLVSARIEDGDMREISRIREIGSLGQFISMALK
jgi:hypothetical protein